MPKNLMNFGGLLCFIGAFSFSGCSKQNHIQKEPRVFEVGKVSSSKCRGFEKSKFHFYIQSGNAPCVKRGFEEGLDPNGVHQDPSGSASPEPFLKMALGHSAIRAAKFENGSYASIVALFLEYGASFNVLYEKVSPLELVITAGAEFSELALYVFSFRPLGKHQVEIDFNFRSSGLSPLEIAIRTKNLSYVEALLNSGASLVGSSQVISPLVQSVLQGTEEIALLLLNRGASPDVFDVSQSSALLLSISMNMKQLFDGILNKTKLINWPNVNKETPLVAASKITDKYFFDKLIERTVDLNSVDSLGRSALFYLVISSDFARVKKLVEMGANLDLLSADGSSLLHVVQSPEVAEYLLKTKKLNIDLLSGSRKTPMAIAVENQNHEVVKVLHENGASVFFLYPNFDSYLHVAVRNNDILLARYLLENGLEVNAQNDANETALFEVRSTEMARLLAKYDAKFTKKNKSGESVITRLFSFEELPDLELLEFLVSKKAPAKAKMQNAKTPIHVVLTASGYPKKHRMEMISMLLLAGADINQPDETYQKIPPIHLCDGLEWVKFFHANGANLSAVDSAGYSLLFHTQKRIRTYQAQVEKFYKISQDVAGSLEKILKSEQEVEAFLLEHGAR